MNGRGTFFEGNTRSKLRRRPIVIAALGVTDDGRSPEGLGSSVGSAEIVLLPFMGEGQARSAATSQGEGGATA
jgi:hypothetical protein